LSIERIESKTRICRHSNRILAVGIVLGVFDYLGLIRVWHLLLISALTGFFVSFEQPVRQSILHHLVPRSELPNAIALY
jgi:hypothetical protein